METVAAPRRRGRRVPDGDMPGGSRDPVAAIGWGCLPLGKAELSPLLPRWTRTTSSAITRARRAVLGDSVAASWADSSRTRQTQHGRAIYVALTGLEFVRRHLSTFTKTSFPSTLTPNTRSGICAGGRTTAPVLTSNFDPCNGH